MTKPLVTLGATVISKAGRDEGRTFLVVEELDENYVLISDGDTHRMAKPKKKKRRHLKVSAEATSEILARLTAPEKIEDHEVRKWLSDKEE